MMPNIIQRMVGGGGSQGDFETRTKIPVVRLTQEGVDKLGHLETGDLRYRIMDAIQSHGTADMQEIADSTGIKVAVVKHHLTELLASGYIQVMNMYH